MGQESQLTTQLINIIQQKQQCLHLSQFKNTIVLSLIIQEGLIENKKLEYHMCASPDIGKLHLTLVIDAMIA